ncbi:2-succinyl-5-enolpyruvyl-6-hydroxy-3-cyclohexene-1-carboxylic-acid synthase, partial [Dermatophilus congolensis]
MTTVAQFFAVVLVDELVRAGVRHVVLSPGSRSAPLAYAALDAERAGLLELHVRTDERSAAFCALGLGKATGVPAVVVTTSGTAVANLHPAVLEAHEARVPLVVVTADRPHELRPTRANQTTHQPGIFGGSVRLALDLEAPVQGASPMPYWRTCMDRTVAAAMGAVGGVPGPVHVNVSLRDPLAPEAGVRPLVGDGLPEELQGRPGGVAWTVCEPASLVGGDGLPEVARTLVVVGDVSGDVRQRAFQWAALRGHPVLAGPFGQGAEGVVVPHGPLVAETGFAAVAENVPDRVVVVGRLTLSRAVGALVRRSGCAVAVSADPVWPDPSHVVSSVHSVGALSLMSPVLSEDFVAAAHDFGRRWREAGVAVSGAVEQVVPGTWPSGPAVAACVLGALPRGARLFCGSSSTVRDVAFVGSGRGDVETVASRGLAGIDGCVSTAAGMALADDRATFALVGDLTFVHDSAGLSVGPLERRPDLTVLVVNDDGGAIFDTLEYGSSDVRGEDPQGFVRLFATPIGTSVEALARAHGARFVRVSTPGELVEVAAQVPCGFTVVEIVVPAMRARVDREALVSAADV